MSRACEVILLVMHSWAIFASSETQLLHIGVELQNPSVDMSDFT